MGAARWVLVFLLVGTSCTPSTGLERADVENYDADHRLRAWRHSRGYDAPWISPRMSHVVRLAFERDDCGGRRSRSACTGTLVARDLILTAAHCLVGTRFIDAQTCLPPKGPGTAPIEVYFDDQTILNSAVLDPRGTARTSLEPLNHAIGIAAVHEDAYFQASKEGGGTCCTTLDELDMVLLRLERPVTSRGVAAIRVPASDPAGGQLLPVVHHPMGGRKQLAVAEVRDTPALLRPLITLFDTNAAAATGSAGLAGGSSGAPLFDEEGTSSASMVRTAGSQAAAMDSHPCARARPCWALPCPSRPRRPHPRSVAFRVARWWGSRCELSTSVRCPSGRSPSSGAATAAS